MIMAMMVTIATHAAAMSYNEARNEALFLTDKMAYELNLSNSQYETVYEINLDYLMSLSYNDVLGASWSLRNGRLRHVLSSYQYDRYMAANYFYRPVSWTNHAWHFGIYARYTNRAQLYRPHPTAYATYRGPHHAVTVTAPHTATRPTPPPATRPVTPPARPTVHNTTPTRPATATHGAVHNTTSRAKFGAHR